MRHSADSTCDSTTRQNRQIASAAPTTPAATIPVERLESRTLFSIMSPAQIKHAYGIDKLTGNGRGQTIAIVGAYADPRIASDLSVFDQRYGISNNDATGRFALSIAAPQGQPAVDA